MYATSRGETDDAPLPMSPQPERSTEEVLAGLNERATYHNADKSRALTNRPTLAGRFIELHCSFRICPMALGPRLMR